MHWLNDVTKPALRPHQCDGEAGETGKAIEGGPTTAVDTVSNTATRRPTTSRRWGDHWRKCVATTATDVGNPIGNALGAF